MTYWVLQFNTCYILLAETSLFYPLSLLYITFSRRLIQSTIIATLTTSVPLLIAINSAWRISCLSMRMFVIHEPDHSLSYHGRQIEKYHNISRHCVRFAVSSITEIDISNCWVRRWLAYASDRMASRFSLTFRFSVQKLCHKSQIVFYFLASIHYVTKSENKKLHFKIETTKRRNNETLSSSRLKATISRNAYQDP
jgi:hypothetical protein